MNRIMRSTFKDMVNIMQQMIGDDIVGDELQEAVRNNQKRANKLRAPDTFPGTKGNKTRNMTFYTDMAESDGARFEISVNNGKSTLHGPAPKDPNHSNGPSWIEFDGVVWEAGNITAKIFDKNGNLVAEDVRYTSGTATSLKLSVDCPSVKTGTGEALVLDGQDAGLIRASVLDKAGRVVHMATNNITFEILSGPARVVGGL